MCMFKFPNRASRRAYLKGVEYFECGACPECLQKKSRLWALRCGMEARVNIGMMITLTYDTYKNGKDGEENPVDPSLVVSKTHAQRFIKRLRKHYPDKSIKYLLTAEYGKRTHRAHYHALIFGVKFDDLRYYKKSKRGNIIYKSPTLEKIWSSDSEHNGGICTVDCINPSAQVARYCTKYCAKDSGVDDTFMLFSRGIGESELLRQFDGKSYWVDGREYSIPRQIWQKYIEKKYNLQGYSRYVGKLKVYDMEKRLCHKLDALHREETAIKDKIAFLKKQAYNHKQLLPQKRGFRSSSCRIWWNERMSMLCDKKNTLFTRLNEIERLRKLYWRVECDKLVFNERAYDRATCRREIYQAYRDNDWLYKRYLNYWKRKNEVVELTRPDEFERILALPDNKYRAYKYKALLAKYSQSKKRGFIPPRSNCHGFIRFSRKKAYEEKSFAPLSRHYRANDTADYESLPLYLEYVKEKAKKIRFYDDTYEFTKEIFLNSPF